MFKFKRKLTVRFKNILIIFGISAIIISFATYAWFVSIRMVSMYSFNIGISSSESLLISLDGKTWSDEVTISKDNYDKTYPNNTNSWGGAGLIPLSSAGHVDKNASRLILFEKAGLTATAGGYRLLASKVQNQGALEKDGYIAFDIFIKNLGSGKYFRELNYLNEEALYLTLDSEVGVALSGDPKTGIENSVRVAFIQIGRVDGDTKDQETITNIKCKSTDKVTGICRDAAIWEPNDTKHNLAAIKYYTASCKQRIGYNIRVSNSYSGNCNTIKDGVSYPTYAINSTISSSHNVDVYDGAAYNKYRNTNKLTQTTTFTDTMKEKTGLDRMEILTLAPTSITKIRVYVYLEGQDIDNYDFASIKNKIEILFGFTKDRFSINDLHTDTGVPGLDVWDPVISIDPDIREITLNVGDTFVLPVATVIDQIGEDLDGNAIMEDITRRLEITNEVDTSVPGVYYVRYNVSDWGGNYAVPIIIEVTVLED